MNAKTLLLAPVLLASAFAAPPTFEITLPELKLPAFKPTPASTDRFVDLFRPPQTGVATLSPDGHYLAYSVREEDTISVVIVATDHLDTAITKVRITNDRLATPRFGRHGEDVPARINWMKWVSHERVVVETNSQTATGATSSLPGMILTFNADGSDAKILTTPRTLPELVTTADVDSDFDTARRNRHRPLGPTVDDPYFNQGGSDAVRNAANDEDPFVDGGLFNSGERYLLSLNSGGGAIEGTAGTHHTYTSPSVFDLNPATPGHVVIRTNSHRFTVRYDLDPLSGKTKQLADYPNLDEYKLLSDRQGVPRLSAPATTSYEFPFQFQLERGPGSRTKSSLADLAGLPADAFTVSPSNFFTARAIPIGFDEDPNILYYASNVGRDTYGLYALDLAQGRPVDFAIEHPSLDLIEQPADAFLSTSPLVFDRFSRKLLGIRFVDQQRSTRWLDPTLQGAQSTLETTLPGQNIEILEWDANHNTMLVFANSTASPGRFYVFNRQTLQLAEFASRAPWLASLATNRVIPFKVTSPTGQIIGCRLTLPESPKVMPAPIIVVCPPNPWERLSADFQPEVQALARMGFAVVQLTARGAWGYGIKAREAVHQGYDATQIDNVLAVLDRVGQAFNLNPKRVGLVGSGWGGYVALRALAAHPDRFRCAITLEPPVDLKTMLSRENWISRDASVQLVSSYYGPPTDLASDTAEIDASTITKPCLVLAYPGPDGGPRRSPYLTARTFARSLRRTSPESEFEELTQDFASGLPLAKSTTYAHIEDFLNTHVYNFNVDIGTSVEMPGK